MPASEYEAPRASGLPKRSLTEFSDVARQNPERIVIVMKKINRTINSLIASAIACLALTAAVPAVTFADEAPQTIGNPTFCFDNDSSNSMWSLYGPTDETGFKLSIAEDIKETGKGSLCISETVAKDIELDERYGGAFITAEQVGLESFAGCTFQVSAKFDEEAAKKG